MFFRYYTEGVVINDFTPSEITAMAKILLYCSSLCFKTKDCIYVSNGIKCKITQDEKNEDYEVFIINERANTETRVFHCSHAIGEREYVVLTYRIGAAWFTKLRTEAKNEPEVVFFRNNFEPFNPLSTFE